MCLFLSFITSLRPVGHHRCRVWPFFPPLAGQWASRDLQTPHSALRANRYLQRGAVQRLLSCLHSPTYSANSTAWEFVQVVTVEQLISRLWHKVMRETSRGRFTQPWKMCFNALFSGSSLWGRTFWSLLFHVEVCSFCRSRQYKQTEERKLDKDPSVTASRP